MSFLTWRHITWTLVKRKQSVASGPFPLNVWRSQRILLSRNAVMSPRSYHLTTGVNSHYVKDSPHLHNQVAFNSRTASISPLLLYTTSGSRKNTGRFRITSYFVVITIDLLHETTRMTKITNWSRDMRFSQWWRWRFKSYGMSRRADWYSHRHFEGAYLVPPEDGGTTLLRSLTLSTSEQIITPQTTWTFQASVLFPSQFNNALSTTPVPASNRDAIGTD